jgi:TRAP-type mannitol/chloroaromatic compound transport system substrate-binding protein
MPAKHQQAMVEACYANITWNTVDQINAQVDAIEKIEAAGVKVQRFPTPVLEALRKASHEVMQEEAAKDPLFKEAYLSLTAYMKRVGRWGQLQALPGTTN